MRSRTGWAAPESAAARTSSTHLVARACYAPLAAGSRAIIKHVDDFRPVHDLTSLADLTAALARTGPRREEGLTTWQGMAQESASPAPA